MLKSVQEIANEQHGSLSQVRAIAAGASSDTVVKASEDRLVRVLVTTTGTNPMQIFDTASAGSGTTIGCLPATPAVGTSYLFDMPASAGITVKGHASNPAVTISYS